MMGVGNLTELTEADTSGINALLFGIAAELDVAAVLTTQVSAHARRAVREADWARRIMHAAARHADAAQGHERRADDGACQAPVPRHARGDRRGRGAGARSELPRPGVGARPARLQPRRPAHRPAARSSCGRSSGWRTTRATPSTWASNWRTPRSPGSSASATCRTSRWTGAARSSASAGPERWSAPGTDEAERARRRGQADE